MTEEEPLGFIADPCNLQHALRAFSKNRGKRVQRGEPPVHRGAARTRERLLTGSIY